MTNCPPYDDDDDRPLGDDETPEEPAKGGYKQPPQHAQFEKGGYSRGRKPGSKNKKRRLSPLEQLISDEGNSPFGKTGLTITQAVVRSQSKTAISGNARAQRDHIQLVRDIEQKDEAARAKELELAEQYVSICEYTKSWAPKHRWDSFVERLPIHPDDIEVDFGAGRVRYNGPVNSYEKRIMRECCEMMETLRPTIIEMHEQATLRRLDAPFLWGLFEQRSWFWKLYHLVPDRMKPARLPAWNEELVPLPWDIGPPVDWSGVEDEPRLNFD